MINFLDVLDINDPETARVVRVTVYREQIKWFESYIDKYPQHKEYYNSIIKHLHVLIEEVQPGAKNVH